MNPDKSLAEIASDGTPLPAASPSHLQGGNQLTNSAVEPSTVRRPPQAFTDYTDVNLCEFECEKPEEQKSHSLNSVHEKDTFQNLSPGKSFAERPQNAPAAR